MESETMLLRHSNISKELTLEGAVLLENNGILPISKQGTVALFGYGAFTPEPRRWRPGGGPGGQVVVRVKRAALPTGPAVLGGWTLLADRRVDPMVL